MHQNRRDFKPWIPTSVPPKTQNAAPDPSYEVIEFPLQQHYSNTSCSPSHSGSQSNEKVPDSKCDLCGSSSAKFHCNMCTQQTFCSSCDLMYHRHPKRQSHIRQRIVMPVSNRETQPPLPPRGEMNPAPIPPPRRNKRPTRPVTAAFRPPQHTTLKKDGSFMGSLKRLVGGIQPPIAPKKEAQLKKSPFRYPPEFENQASSKGSDYLDWDSENRHRSGSFTPFHAPAFAPLIQAQSLAQLNCPSCHTRSLSTAEWSRSQMNLNAFPPWPGGAYSANPGWHSLNTFQPKYKLPPNVLNRRGSLNQRYNGRGRQYSSDEDDVNNDSIVNDDRKCRKVSPVSPLRNQSSATMLSDTDEEETMSRRSDRRFKKRTKLISREPSPALSRRNHLRRCDDDDDTLSMKSAGSRRSVRSSTSRSFLRRNTTPNLSDSDDELTSDRDEAPFKVENRPPTARLPKKFPEKPSDSLKSQQMAKASVRPQVAEITCMPKENNVRTSVGDDNGGGWECEYCTFLNVKSSRVCDVCCKSRSAITSEQISDNAVDTVLDESMANIHVSDAGHSKKDDELNEHIDKRMVSTLLSSPPQTTSTQTCGELTADHVAEIDRLKSCEGYISDCQPQKDFGDGTKSHVDDKKLKSSAPDSSINDDCSTTNNSVIKSQIKHGLEIIKLLREAENYQFTVEDLTAALAQCGDANPIQWLLENWNKLTESVVTLSTNYGREQPENTIGTISCSEATSALRLHNGNLWAAATECIRQRQKKYDLLMAKGNFSREDVVTVLTANHGDLEAANMELNKSYLRPFLMKIWGPPQGLDNDSGDTESQYDGGAINIKNCRVIQRPDDLPLSETEFSGKSRVKRWLKMDLLERDEQGVQNVLNNDSKLVNNFSPMEPSEPTSYSSCENLTSEHHRRSLYSEDVRRRLSGRTAFPPQKYSDNREVPERDGDEESNNNVYEFLVKEYIKLNLEEEEEPTDLRSSDNTEDDSVSELPVDSIASSEAAWVEQQSRNDPARNFVTTHIPAEGVEIDSEIADRSENLKGSTTDYSTASMQYSNNDSRPDDLTKVTRTLKAKFDAHPLLTELQALCLLVKHNLDSYVIGTRDTVTEDTNIIKKWVDFNSHSGTNYVTGGQDDVDDRAPNLAHRISKYEGETVTLSEDDGPLTILKRENSHTLRHDGQPEEYVSSAPSSSSGHIFSEESISFGKLYHNQNAPLENEVENKGDEEGATKYEFELEQIKHNGPIELAVLNTEEKGQPLPQRSRNDGKTLRHSEEEKVLVLSNSERTRGAIFVNGNEESSQIEENLGIAQRGSEREFTVDNRRLDFKIQNPKNDFHEPEARTSSRRENSIIEAADSVQTSDIRRTSRVEMNEKLILRGNEELDQFRYMVPSSFMRDKLKAEKSPIIEPLKTIVKMRSLTSSPPSPSREAQNQFSEKNARETDGGFLKIEPMADELRENVENEGKENLVEHSELNKPNKLFTSVLERVTLRQRKVEDTNSFQARARECLSSGLVSTYDQAEVAVQLMELKFDRSQSIDAATECSSIYAALNYLQQECQLCTEKFSMKQMVPSLGCEHQCCRNCAEQYYTLQITENNIDDCVCPFCQKPGLRDFDSDAILNYFSNLDILLKSILKPETHELFQQKLRDRTLMQDPNFKWCAKCSFGFITDPNEKRLSCPSCKTLICAKCGKSWSYEHTGKTCDEYKRWLETQTDSNHELSSYMENNGIACPKCDAKFILVRGGCMHLTCSQCKYEFCSDCQKPFNMGTNCGVSDSCNKLGLHAHHPRNCLFYLRDKEPLELKQLLQANNIELNLQASDSKKCQVQLQKETENGFEDTQCGARVEEAGLCKIHYTEYLANLIRKNKVDPIVIFDLAEILQEFRRRGKSLPVRPANTFEHEYRTQCIQIVKKEFPLE